MGEHTVSSFDEELDHIDRLLREMSKLAAAMVHGAIAALTRGDKVLAQRVVSDDAVMDAHQRELDDSAITLIAKRQPMALDLRMVVGAIRMAGDLERIGDLAKNIAKRVGAVAVNAAPVDSTRSIDDMAELVIRQIGAVAAGYSERRPEGLADLRADDERIDAKYTAVFRELLTYMMEDATSDCPPTSCSAPRTSSASATTRPTSPRPSTSSSRA